MTKTIALFLAHALAVIAVMTTFGVLGLQREDQEAQERFTGAGYSGCSGRIRKRRNVLQAFWKKM